MKTYLKTYAISLKKGHDREIHAYGMTEDKEEKRIYFHKKEDLSDRVTFFSTSQIAGVEEILNPNIEALNQMTHEDFNKMIQEIGRKNKHADKK